MATTIKVLNLPKLRWNCPSDTSCSPSLVGSHGRAAGSLPHPLLSRVHRSRCSGISLPGGLVTVSEFTETDNVVRMCTPHFSLAHLILIAVIQSGNRLEPRADVNDTPDKIDQECRRQRNKVNTANLWLWTFYWCSIAEQTLGELACCWITSKAGVNSDFVFILKRITDRFVFSLSTRIRENTEELNSKWS